MVYCISSTVDGIPPQPDHTIEVKNPGQRTLLDSPSATGMQQLLKVSSALRLGNLAHLLSYLSGVLGSLYGSEHANRSRSVGAMAQP